MKTMIITGGSGGLGKEIGLAARFSSKPFHVIDWSLETSVDVTDPEQLKWLARDLPEVDVLVNCAGFNHPKWFLDEDKTGLEKAMSVNAFSIVYATQALLSTLERTRGTVLNVVSNASHAPMTASMAYNASKAAAHMITLQMARELYKTHGVTVFGVSPNKLKATGMSKSVESIVPGLRGWTPEEARQKQLDSLPIGEETEPGTLSRFIAFLLSEKRNHKYLHGTILPYGG